MSDYYYDPSDGMFAKIRKYKETGVLKGTTQILADKAILGLKKYATRRSELPDAWDVDYLLNSLEKRKNKNTRNYKATETICYAYDKMRRELRETYHDMLIVFCGFLKQLEENKKLKAILEEEGIDYEDRLA